MAVYDDRQTDDLNDLTGIDRAAEKKMEYDANRGATQDIADRENLYNPGGDSGGSTDKSASSTELDSAEKGAAGSGGSLYNSEKDATPNFRQRFKGGAAKLLKNKWAVGLLAGGGGSAVILVIILVVLLGSLKIPNFAQHIAAYQFARVTRTMAKNSERIAAQKMGIEAADNTLYAKLGAKYGGLRDNTWGKLDKYRPNKVIDNFKTSDTLKFNYGEPGILGRQQLLGVTIGNKSVPVNSDARLASKLIPGVQFGKNVSFAKEFAPALDQALRANDIGPIVRGKVAKQIRQQLGISLIAWKVGKYQGKTDAEARALITQDTYHAVSGNDPVTNPKVSSQEINQTAEDVKAAQTAAVDSPEGIKAIVEAPNELPQGVIDALEKSSVSSLGGAVKAAIGFANPLYAVAVPVCLIYDGSLEKSGSTINTQNAQLQRQFYLVASSANQQMDGYQASGEAVGAMNWKLGNIEKSNPELRAGGQKVNTSNYASVQASPTGQFSIADALFPEAIAGVLNEGAKSCPAITNVWLGGTLGVINILAVFASGGTAGGAEAGAVVAVEQVTPRLMTRVLAKYTTTKAFAKVFAKDTAKQVSAIVAGTIIAKMIVMSQVGAAHSSLATDTSFNNDADSGGNLAAGRIMQQQFSGRPLTSAEASASNVKDQLFATAQTKHQSLYERYASLSNADSLLTRFGTTLSTNLNPSLFSSLLGLGSKLFNPVAVFGNSLGMFSPRAALAASSVDNSNYGNVQWGWSDQENALIDGDDSYKMLPNQAILDASGNQDKITAEYGKCFDGSLQMGDMLADKYIVRDTDGNILSDDSLCSPKSLGVNNPTYGNMVFRWRVAQSYNNTLDQLMGAQDITESSAIATSPPAAPATGQIVGNVGESSSSVDCAANTKDLGTVTSKYSGALKQGSGPLTIRLCQLSSIGGSGDNPQGSNVSGGAVLNSRVAGAWQALGEKAKAAKPSGVQLSATSSFRLNDSCGGTGNGSACAKPGQSLHQLGVAIDFATMTVKGTSTMSCSGRGTQVGNKGWDWLNNNAAQFGFKQYSFESWHWDSLTSDNRCGGDGTI